MIQQMTEMLAEQFSANVCSIYLLNDETNELILKATFGLNKSAIGNVTLKLGEGLVGLVMKTGEPIIESHASQNPNFHYIPEIGEEAFDDGGIAVTCRGSKMRDTRPFTKIPFTINFTKGVTRYSGLFDFCLEYGLIEKKGMQYMFIDEIAPADSPSFFKKKILASPEAYFTQDVLVKLNEALKPVFLFGNSVEVLNKAEETDAMIKIFNGIFRNMFIVCIIHNYIPPYLSYKK
jgi:hypothetical protein